MINNVLKFTGLTQPSKGDKLNDLRKQEAENAIALQMLKNQLGIIGEQKLQLDLFPQYVQFKKSELLQKEYETCNEIMKRELHGGKLREQIQTVQGLKG